MAVEEAERKEQLGEIEIQRAFYLRPDYLDSMVCYVFLGLLVQTGPSDNLCPQGAFRAPLFGVFRVILGGLSAPEVRYFAGSNRPEELFLGLANLSDSRKLD